jgi:hypothetical protein
MNKIQQLQKLAELEKQSQDIRERLKISPANELLYRGPLSTWSDMTSSLKPGGEAMQGC